MKKQSFKAERVNGKWAAIAYPNAAYHLPAIIKYFDSREEAKEVVAKLNQIVNPSASQ